ncbi:hypothetical protein GCM10022222_67280 [Amycolatopsis ultiminotia]|uniref:HTH tetR-type domain-containing protein n=1 Tax=Amycolatopsis ultiminotia TaxID=543629 RepID=A0ABP6XWD9_9PSEU
MEGPLPRESLTARQIEKYDNALHSVVRLVHLHGVAAVNLKSVSADSGVALATLYRFFNSKDHLFAAAFDRWQTPLVEVGEPDLRDGSDRGRASAYIVRGTRSFQRTPNMLGLLVFATVSTDPFASEQMLRSRRRNSAGLAKVITDAPEAVRAIAVAVLESFWWDQLVEWHTGRCTHAQLLERVDSAIDVLLPG